MPSLTRVLKGFHRKLDMHDHSHSSLLSRWLLITHFALTGMTDPYSAASLIDLPVQSSNAQLSLPPFAQNMMGCID